MLSTFFSLAVCLEAIVHAAVHAAQQLADSHRRNFVTQFFQLLLKIAQTAGGPQNDPHRVASSHWLYKPLKIGQESRVLNFLGLASASHFSRASRPSRTFATNVENAARHRWGREACHLRH